MARRGLDHALARQMRREWLARRSPAGERRDIDGVRGRLLGGDFVGRRRAFQFVECQGKLVEQALATFRPLAIELMP